MDTCYQGVMVIINLNSPTVAIFHFITKNNLDDEFPHLKRDNH